MKSATVYKSLANRHHLVLTHGVEAEDSTISFNSILSLSGAIDQFLVHGAVGHTEASIALRRLPLKDSATSKLKYVDLFVISVPTKSNSNYCLLISPESLPVSFMKLVNHTQGNRHKGLSDNQHHQVYMRHQPQPDEQAFARNLAARLPESVNLEETGDSFILFTALAPDQGQAEHLLRLAIELS